MQALALMNSPLIRQMAEKLATEIRKSSAAEPAAVVEATFWKTLSRPPSAEELESMVTFINSQAQSYGEDGKAMDTAIADYCQTMLCLNEFVYVD